MTDYQYFDPYLKEQERQQQRQQQAAQAQNQNGSFFGDLVDAFQRGAYQSFGGDAEAVGQVSDSDAFKQLGQELSRRADAQTQTMTPESQAALSKRIFRDDADSFTGVALDEGATDWRTWALQFGALGGQIAGMIGVGGPAGMLAKGAGKLALRGIAKEAITKEAQQLVAKNAVKEAIRNGALEDVRSALTSAPTREAMNAALDKAASRLSVIGVTAATGAMSAGMRAQQAREEYMGLDADALNQNPAFQEAYWQLADMPENQGLDTTALHNAAREMLAEKAATAAFGDEKALLADFTAGALGGYVGGLGGLMGKAKAGTGVAGRFAKGMAVEGGTEAWQGGETQRAVNEAIKEWSDESRDPMAGVLSTRYEEGVLGGLFGGVADVVAGNEAHGPATVTTEKPSKPLITVPGSSQTGNPVLDQALAASDQSEQASYGNLTDELDRMMEIPAYVRQGFLFGQHDFRGKDIPPPLEGEFIPAGTDLMPLSNGTDIAMSSWYGPNFGPYSRGRGITNNPLDQITDQRISGEWQSGAEEPQTPIAGLPGRTIEGESKGTQLPYRDIVYGQDQRQSGANAEDMQRRKAEQESWLRNQPVQIGQSDTIFAGGTPGADSRNSAYTPPRLSRDQVDVSLGEQSIRDPRYPVGESINQAGSQSDAIFSQLKTVRVTKKGKPFTSQKEAQLASRKTETPIELPTGGFGVVEKAELEQVQNNINQLPDVNDINVADIQSSNGQAIAPDVDVNASPSNGVVAQNQPVINDNTPETSQATSKQVADQAPALDVKIPDNWDRDIDTMRDLAKGLHYAGVIPKKWDVDIAWDNPRRLHDLLKKHIDAINGTESQLQKPGKTNQPAIAVSENTAESLDPQAEQLLTDLANIGVSDVDIKKTRKYAIYKGKTPEERLDIIKNEVDYQTRIAQLNGSQASQEDVTQHTEKAQKKTEKLQSADTVTLSTGAAFRSADDALTWAKQHGLEYTHYVEQSGVTGTGKDGYSLKKLPDPSAVGDYVVDKYFPSERRVNRLGSTIYAIVGGNQQAIRAYAVSEFGYSAMNNEMKLTAEARSQIGTDNVTLVSDIDRFERRLARGNTAANPSASAVQRSSLIEHVTAKGKVLRGVVRTDLSADEAKAIDPGTFKKNGGYFIREKHLSKLPVAPGGDANHDGNHTKIYTPDGKPVDIQYRVVEAGTLITSHNFDGAVNPDYPAELQPRDRRRAASLNQLHQIAQNPEPQRLTISAETDRGAPVVKDGIVESGNGRSIGLKEAYVRGNADAYHQHLIDHAADYGIEPEVIRSMSQPILIRERKTEMTPEQRRAFTVDSNRSAGLSLGASEQATSDAAGLTNDMLALLAIPEGGDVLSRENDPFLNRFGQMLGSNELAQYKATDGTWNQAYRKRVENAIFAKGFGDPALINEVAESTKPEVKNLLTGLINVSGKLAELRGYDNDSGDAIARIFAEAARLIARSRREGQSIDELLSQGDLLGGGVSDEAGITAKLINNNARSARKITEILNNAVTQLITNSKNRNQPDIFTGETPDTLTVKDALDETSQQFRQLDTGKPGKDLFGANPPRLDTAAKTSTESTDGGKREEGQPEVSQRVENGHDLIEHIYQALLAAEVDLSNNNALKKLMAGKLGVATKDITNLQLKQAQEAYETAAAQVRRNRIKQILNQGGDVSEAFEYAVTAYQHQPNLDVRSANSANMQAYSTPTPMALLANLAAGINGQSTVFEPTAGNGLLLLTSNSDKVYANELDPVRAANLTWAGMNVTTLDAAMSPLEGMVPQQVDAVVTNPPFGTFRDESGRPAKMEITDEQGRTHTFGELDHVIAVNALDAMKDDGKATLILGAPKEAGIYTGNHKAFLNYLYSNYNVVHHIEAEGALYNGQGAGWPTQMIVIHGRRASGTGKYAPIKGQVQRLATWDAIYDSFSEKGLLDTTGRFDRSRTGTGDVRTTNDPAADGVGRAARPDGFTAVPVSGTGTGRSAQSEPATGSVERSGRRGRGKAAAGTFDSQPDIGSDGLGETESAPATTRKGSGSRAKPDDLGLSGQRNDRPVGRTVQTKALDTKVDKANEFQATYKTASGGLNQGVLTPLNMASYTQKALMDIQERHGGVDQYVADRLGYPSTEALHQAFMGLQADAVALGVDAVEQGRAIIIGDQTGVGKGRQAAGMIRYALQKGMIPIFVTQKPNLFTDMYDDLADIGVKDFTPLIMNDENGFVTKTDKATDKVTRLFNHSASKRAALLDQVRSTGKLPDGFNALFLTYSQISSDNNGSKASVLSSVMENAMLIMDESHTAAGQDSKLGQFFKGAVQSAKGVTYLSATYAKRPDNMGLYIRTDLGLAVDNFDRLQSIINNGGLGMQIYIAGKLAEAGQMVRRERSFDGIEIRNRVMADKTGKTAEDFDQVTEVLRGIQDLSRAWRFYVENELSDQIQMESGLDTRIAGNQADTKINVTLFSSVVHNYIAQLSLGLKAKLAAQQAIAAIKEGKRPVIAVENTMGSALDTFMERNNLRMGDSASGLSYTSLLKTIADDVLSYSVKEPGTKKGRRVTMKINDVSDEAVRALYRQVMDLADSLRVDVPASPIDAIRHEVTKAGYTVAEITGRDRMVDYADNAKISYRPALEENRRAVVDRFNNNELDVLILNQAGSTGLSLHASEKFRDQKPRHMIVAQPSLDINTFMQMLGRINRTGQVVLPTYDLLWLDLPSEKRPAAILSRKMASLNANTSGNTESATSVESADLLNPYGNQVVSAFIAANRDMLAGYSASLLKEEEDQAAYFLGKLAVVPSAVQKQIIEQVEAEYKELIDYLDATGQNELNMTEVDLDAKPLAQRVLTEGRKDAGVFSEPAYITQVDAKAQGRAPKWDEVKAELAESSQAEFDEAVATMIADQDFEARLRSRIAKVEKEISDRKANGKKYDQEEKEITNLNDRLTEYLNDRRVIERQFSAGGVYAHGAAIRVKLPDAEHAVTGIVTGLTYDHTSGNPAAPSKWRMRVLLADRTRTLPLSLSRAREGMVEGPRQDTEANLKAVFDRAAEMPTRETRYILTGNLVAAQDRASERGRIIPFTTQDGRVIQGMLMPKKFDPNKGVLEKAEITPASGFEWLSKTKDRTLASLGLRTADNQVVVRRNYSGSGYAIEMPKAVSKGKRYWGAPEMAAIIGEQAVKGNGTFTVKLTEEQAKQVIKVMQDLNPLTLTDQSQIKDYQAMRGVKTPEFSSHDIKFSKRAQADSAGKGMTRAEAELVTKQWLKQLNTQLNVQVVADQAAMNAALAKQGVTDDVDANAAYLPGSKTLLINAAAMDNPRRLRQILRHEVLVHHGLRQLAGDAAFARVKELLLNGYTTSKAIRAAFQSVAKNYQGDTDTMLEEVLAHYAENRPVDGGPISRVWQSVIRVIKAALQKVGLLKGNETEAELDDVLRAIAENLRQGKGNNPGPDGGSKVLFSKQATNPTAFGQAESVLKATGNTVLNWMKEKRAVALGTLTDLQIDQIYREITGGTVGRYQQLRTLMESDRNDILLQAETEIEPKWEALGKAAKAGLSDLMHDATMNRLHPDRSLEDNTLYQETKGKLGRAKTAESKAALQAELDGIRKVHQELAQRYRLLDKPSRELYDTMRKLYEAQWQTLRQAIEQRISDVMGAGGKALASQLRLKMEKALQHGPYFPLARFGDYVVKAKKDGDYIREHFEKREDAEAALNQYRADGFDAVLTVKEQGSGNQANMHALGMEVMKALDEAQTAGTAPADMKDTIWQAMLELLPDASYAKHAIHRRRVKGASRDGHRAYLQSVYHYAHHLSKIRYGHKMKAELDGLKEDIQKTQQGETTSIKRDEVEIAQQVLNEMNRRHELNMNPKGSALAGKLGNLGFLFYLGASPAAAVVNLTQNATVMLPQLGGKFGFAKAAGAMMRAMGDYVRHGQFKAGTKEAWVSLTRAKPSANGVTADEIAMLNKLYKAGVLDLTQAHSIAARADTDQQNVNVGAAWTRTAMRWAGSLFHNAEVLNREVAALTAYRLLKEKNPSLAQAAMLEQVTEMVYDGHGNYAASNRPRYMRGDVAKVLTQFKIYSQMMTYTLTRNAILAAKGDKQAMKTLGGLLGMTWVMAGAMGLPTPVAAILYGMAALGDDDDDRSAEASFRLGLTEVMGPELGELIAKGPMDALTSLNISGRTGLGDLWWRSPKEGAEGDDLTFHYLQQAAGPVLGIGVSAVRGLRSFADGDIQRGIEAMAPKVIKDLAKAERQAREGERTRNGDSIIDDVGAWNIAAQAMGFNSADMAKTYSAREYIKGKEKVIEERRSNLLADYFAAMQSGDAGKMADVLAAIREFNATHAPSEAITGKKLKQSIKSRERSGERTQAGTYLSESREYLRSEGAFLNSR